MFKKFTKYGITLRLVEESDSDFIVKIRTDIRKARFISETNSIVLEQKKWIKAYKTREILCEEYYIIAIDEDNEKFATYRLYNKTEASIEIGSFVSCPEYNNPINIIKVDVLLKEYVFEALGFVTLNFEVRKKNTTVISYHKKFQPIKINEDEHNYYFVLEKEAFLKNKLKFEKLF